ncbi:hypothetical protein LC608_30230 [Nostoc sp. XA010]|uniref:WD40 repeat domain-containing protein n=1 Tax=Nostoc sp. XA010 TaxID=2780407 RepID=UPI001E3DFCA4|nr:WD40 repeat domain-containing protein [Nostoc sp. XA010]MCC5661165.1 hypothetical protein [Nostoc sp. XA010]
MSQQPPDNSDSQQPDADPKQQADSSIPQNVVQGNQNRAVQGNENQGVLGDSNTVVQGNNSTQNIHITNYYYREDIRVAAVQPASDALSDEKLPCPYRGLFHFSPDDAEYFFGREVFIEELFRATQTRNFIPVLGASGSGKSSVVFAGLVPKLQQEGHWLFTHFRPGANPFYGLAEALVPLYTPDLDDTDRIAQTRKLSNYFCNGDVLLVDVIAKIQQNHPNNCVLLIADQFEELFTLCKDEKIRRSFLDCLLTIIQSPTSKSLSAVFVATMRVDFLSYALSYPEFADQLKPDIKIRSMNRSELSEVIACPAQKLGVTFEPGLIERILDDVESEPGNLPLLEFALTLLWEKRTLKQLTHTAYEAIGEVQGALANYADEQYGHFNAVEQEQVRRIFIQLVRPGEGTQDTRRVATKAEFSEEDWTLVKQLADMRLVVTNQNAANQKTVEVVHEALIRNWVKFRNWIEKYRDFRAWQERLRVAIAQWEQTQQDEGTLLRGAALAYAEEKLKQNQENLAQGEQDFIHLSIELHNRLLRQQKERKTRQMIVASITSIILAGFAILAGINWKVAEGEKVNAQLNAQSLSSDILLSKRKNFEALIEALKAAQKMRSTIWVRTDTQTKVTATLLKAISQVREKNSFSVQNASITSISFSPDGKTIASSGEDLTIKLWNPDGKEIKTIKAHEGTSFDPMSIDFSSDSKIIISGSGDKTIKLWNTTNGYEISSLIGHRDLIYSVSFSPDGKTIASASSDGIVILWSLDLNKLLVHSCNWLRDYFNNPNNGLSENAPERHLCDRISV